MYKYLYLRIDDTTLDEIRKEMGDKAYYEYQDKLFVYFQNMPVNTYIEIEKIIKPVNKMLFYKSVSRFMVLRVLKIRFEDNYKKIEKYG